MEKPPTQLVIPAPVPPPSSSTEAWPYDTAPENLEKVEGADLAMVKEVFKALWGLHMRNAAAATVTVAAAKETPASSSEPAPANNNNTTLRPDPRCLSKPEDDTPTKWQVIKIGTEHYDCLAYGYSQPITLDDLNWLAQVGQPGWVIDSYILPSTPIKKPAVVVQVRSQKAFFQYRIGGQDQQQNLASLFNKGNNNNNNNVLAYKLMDLDRICKNASNRAPISPKVYSKLEKEYRPESFKPINDVACAIIHVHASNEDCDVVEIPDLPIYFGWDSQRSVYNFYAQGFRSKITRHDMQRIYFRSDLLVRQIGYLLQLSITENSEPGMLMVQLEDCPSPTIAVATAPVPQVTIDAMAAAATPPPAATVEEESQVQSASSGNSKRKRDLDESSEHDVAQEILPSSASGGVFGLIKRTWRVLTKKSRPTIVTNVN